MVLRGIAGTAHKSPSAFDLDFGLTYYGDNFKRSSSLEHVLLHIRRRAATIILVSNLRKYKSTYGMMEMLRSSSGEVGFGALLTIPAEAEPQDLMP